MERSQILEIMSGLKLFGMKAAYDEIIATAVKRQHEPQRIVGDLLTAEIAEKQARSIKYQMTIARLPLAKDLGDFAFDNTPINATLVHDLAADEHHIALVGEELAAGEIVHQGGVDRGAVEGEVAEVLGQRQPGDGHLVLD